MAAMRLTPRGGGTFWFQIFIQAPSLEIWRKTISGAEEGSGEEVGWPVLGYLLGKNYRRRDCDHLVPHRRMDAAVCCRTEGVLSSVEAREGIGQ